MQNVSFRVGACKGMLEHAARGQQQLFSYVQGQTLSQEQI